MGRRPGGRDPDQIDIRIFSLSLYGTAHTHTLINGMEIQLPMTLYRPGCLLRRRCHYIQFLFVSDEIDITEIKCRIKRKRIKHKKKRVLRLSRFGERVWLAFWKGFTSTSACANTEKAKTERRWPAVFNWTSLPSFVAGSLSKGESPSRFFSRQIHSLEGGIIRTIIISRRRRVFSTWNHVIIALDKTKS